MQAVWCWERELLEAPPNGSDQIRVPFSPERMCNLVDIWGLHVVSRQPLQPSNEARSCSFLLEVSECSDDIPHDSLSVVVVSGFLDSELLIQSPETSRSSQLAQAKGGSLTNE